MAEDNRMQQQLGEIGLRYLKRTVTEIATLRDMLAKLRAGEASSLKEIEHLSHKIHGSGAMFGFDALSSEARQIELAAGSSANTPELHAQLEQYIAGLENAAAAAAKERGIQ
jgi:HPt (histidine-containing phosphotransfer) domain-containing protein